MNNDETELIRARYARRRRSYDPWRADVFMPRQEFERAVIRILSAVGNLPALERTLLDVGCGTGGNLDLFVRLGFKPGNLVGVELLESRADTARQHLPSAISIHAGDALRDSLPEAGFDIVFQSLVFSSILDDEYQQALADKMWRLAKPGGGILWYDFVYDNPWNRDVRGVPMSRLRSLFPAVPSQVQWTTLAPPVSRFMCAVHPRLYSIANCLLPLRSHRLCWIGRT